jgi:hypothetical protein
MQAAVYAGVIASLALKLMHILSPEQGDQILYFGQSKLQTG